MTEPNHPQVLYFQLPKSLSSDLRATRLRLENAEYKNKFYTREELEAVSRVTLKEVCTLPNIQIAQISPLKSPLAYTVSRLELHMDNSRILVKNPIRNQFLTLNEVGKHFYYIYRKLIHEYANLSVDNEDFIRHLVRVSNVLFPSFRIRLSKGQRHTKITFHSRSPSTNLGLEIVNTFLKYAIKSVLGFSSEANHLNMHKIAEGQGYHYRNIQGWIQDVSAFKGQSLNDPCIELSRNCLSVKRKSGNVDYISLAQQEIFNNSRLTDKPMSQKVRYVIEAYSLYDELDLNKICDILSVSRRTLQRKLSLENLTYSDVLNKSKRKLVFVLMRRCLYSITEVSQLLGYSNVTAFYKAYENWFTVTPSKLNKALRAKYI